VEFTEKNLDELQNIMYGFSYQGSLSAEDPNKGTTESKKMDPGDKLSNVERLITRVQRISSQIDQLRLHAYKTL
jgi:hypothetical protein